MRRTPIRAKDSPGFIANRLARPYSLESLRMLADGVADAATIDRVCRLGGGFRMGPFELIDLIGLDVNLSVARSFYEQGGAAGALATEPDPGSRWSRPASSGARAARATTAIATARHRPDDPELGLSAPTLDPDDLARIDPGGGRDPPPPRRPDRQRDRLRPRREGRHRRRHEHRDAARLQLAAGPDRVLRVDRRRPGRRPARMAASRARRRLRAGAAPGPAAAEG